MKKLLDKFAELTYVEQRKVLADLQDRLKKPDFSIKFAMTTQGLMKCANVAKYCMKRDVKFTVEKGKVFTRFHFQGLSTRNTALIGGMTI